MVDKQIKAQTGKKRGSYKYYVFSGEINQFFNENFTSYNDVLITKALNSKNARNKIYTHYLESGRVRNRHHIETGQFITEDEWEKNSKEFLNKKEAEKAFEQLKNNSI